MLAFVAKKSRPLLNGVGVPYPNTAGHICDCQTVRRKASIDGLPTDQDPTLGVAPSDFWRSRAVIRVEFDNGGLPECPRHLAKDILERREMRVCSR
jgi:hypothetical protein